MDKALGETISVIVPAYQAERFLKNCITGICEQTYKDLEILIIDNGSTDATGAIAEEMRKQDARIRVIHEENRGVSGARNTGMEQAAGAYLTFVDADDRPAPDMLERLYQMLQDEKCDVAGCAFRITDSCSDQTRRENTDGSIKSTENVKNMERTGSAKNAGQNVSVMNGREFIRERIFDGDTRCWSKLYRREAVGGIRFRRDLTIGEDMLFILEVMKQDIRVAHTDYQGYDYYRNPEGAMEKRFTPGYMDQITCWQEARRQVTALFPDDNGLAVKVDRILLVSVMLVAGKLAMADKIKAGEKRSYVEQCLQTIRTMDRRNYAQAIKLLGRGDRFKVAWFSHMPHSYLFLWKLCKKIHAI